MGRKSREKRERRERKANSPLALALRDFSPQTVLPLLEAASVSPGAAHLGPSLGALFLATVQRGARGQRPAGADDLPGFVAAAHAEYDGGMAALEDFQPCDARSEVLIPWNDQLFRVVPGSLGQPIAMVNRHARLARSIDKFLTGELGFGLIDVGEIIFRRVDMVARHLAPHWGQAAAAGVGDGPAVSVEEAAAATRLPSAADVLGACVDPRRAQLAAKAFTAPSEKLVFNPADTTAAFGAVIAAATRQEVTLLPAGILVEALPAVGDVLAQFAANKSPDSERAFVSDTSAHVGELLLGSGLNVVGPVRAHDEQPIHSLVVFDDRLVVALDVAAGLTPESIQRQLDRGARGLAAIRPGVHFNTPTGSGVLPEDANVVHLQIIEGPQHGTRLGTTVPTISLDDLAWILRSTHSAREALWYFVSDLADPGPIGTMLAFDPIDKWEVWKQKQSFYTGGVPLDMLMFGPHAGDVEWREAVVAAPIERALHQLDLPPLRSWPVVDLDSDGVAHVGDLRTNCVYQILPLRTPVAVANVDSGAPSEHFKTLWDLAVGLASKISHCANVFVSAATDSGVSALTITFEYQTRNTGPVLTIQSHRAGRLTIGWDNRLLEALTADSLSVERICGEIVAQAFAEATRAPFTASWNAAPPSVRADAVRIQQQAHTLPEPIEVRSAIQSRTLQLLGEHIAAEGVGESQLTGSDATEFESRVVFPWLVRKFHDAIEDLRADDLLQFALGQLERSNYHRLMFDTKLSWELSLRAKSGDDDSRRRRLIRSTRVTSFVIEETLAQPPSGSSAVDDLRWTEVLSIADLCVESCLRSDEIHHGLTPIAIEISNLSDIRIGLSDEPATIDMAAFNKARTAHALPVAEPISTGGQAIGDPDENGFRPFVDLMPSFADIDSAMRAELGFGIDAMTGVLNVARQFAATSAAPATLTERDRFLQECHDLATGAPVEQFAAALDWLTLRRTDLADDLIPHWEVERRAKRLATSPFVQTDDGIWVLPWTAEAALRILTNYLGDGRLPWPHGALPSTVTQALNQYRQGQNRQLEQDCLEALDTGSLVVRRSIEPRKQAHYGITGLRGEIDVLCIDPERSHIWVLEAKDPYEPFTARQTRRLLEHFIEPGGYVDTLLGKVGVLEANASAVAQAHRLPDPDRPWSVLGLMVTRRPVPAAFAVDARVAFCLIDDLADVVHSSALPHNGMN